MSTYLFSGNLFYFYLLHSEEAATTNPDYRMYVYIYMHEKEKKFIEIQREGEGRN